MSDTDWPYDADRDDPLAALRIPVVRDPYPARAYTVCVMIDTSERALWPSLRPDEAETRQLVAFLEYQVEHYAGTRARREGLLFDVAAWVNTVTLRKRPDGGWTYRMATWQDRSSMSPGPDQVLTLEQLLDRIHSVIPERWAAHKAKYPGVFTGAAA